MYAIGINPSRAYDNILSNNNKLFCACFLTACHIGFIDKNINKMKISNNTVEMHEDMFDYVHYESHHYKSSRVKDNPQRTSAK